MDIYEKTWFSWFLQKGGGALVWMVESQNKSAQIGRFSQFVSGERNPRAPLESGNIAYHYRYSDSRGARGFWYHSRQKKRRGKNWEKQPICADLFWDTPIQTSTPKWYVFDWFESFLDIWDNRARFTISMRKHNPSKIHGESLCAKIWLCMVVICPRVGAIWVNIFKTIIHFRGFVSQPDWAHHGVSCVHGADSYFFEEKYKATQTEQHISAFMMSF